MIVELTIPGVRPAWISCKKIGKFMNVVKNWKNTFNGRDSITLGPEFSGYVSQLDHGLISLENTLSHLSELKLGRNCCRNRN